jgi:hypothetical protein
MPLDEFANNKTGNNKDYLKSYTKLDNIETINLTSLISDDDLKQLQQKQKEYKEKQKLFQEQRKKREEHNNEWQIVKETDNIQVIENFINKYNDYSEHIEEAKQRIIEIEAQQEQEKLQKIEQEIEEKWNSIQKLDKKLQESAIKKFLERYSDSKFVPEANKLLDELSTPTTTKKGIDELNIVKDSRRFKTILEDNKENLNENKEVIKQNAIRVFNSLKGKKQKNFFKEIQLARFLGKDFEEDVKKHI